MVTLNIFSLLFFLFFFFSVNIVVGAIFASRPSVALVIFFDLESPTLEEKPSSFYLIRHEPMELEYPFIVGAIFASRPSVALVIIFGLESPTLEGKPSSFYLIRDDQW